MGRHGQPGGRAGLDIGSLFSAQARAQGHRPFLTFYDDSSGERTELSYATFFNWTSKSANLLTEEARLELSGTVGVSVTDHWTGAVLIVAAWTVGAAVAFDAEADRDVLVVPEPSAAGYAGHQGLVVVGAGMGGRVTGDPPGIAFGDEVLAFGDDYGDPDVTADAVALGTDPPTTHRDLIGQVDGVLAEDDRLLVTSPMTAGQVALLLLAPAAAGASVVWCPHGGGPDLTSRVAAERVTKVLHADGTIAPPA